MEFIMTITSSFWFESIFKLILGFLLSGIIGLERSSWNKPAGFRTYALVGISAVLIMLCGEYMSGLYDIDPSRIPAQLLSGIGFIGAGTIIRDGFNVKGLTTAAGLLAVTCIGLSIGSGFYLGGILTTLIVYIVLSYSYKFADKLDHFEILEFKIGISDNFDDTLKQIEKIFSTKAVEIKHMKRLNNTNDNSNLNAEIDNTTDDTNKYPEFISIICHYNKKDFNKNEFISLISSIDNVSEITET